MMMVVAAATTITTAHRTIHLLRSLSLSFSIRGIDTLSISCAYIINANTQFLQLHDATKTYAVRAAAFHELENMS